MKQTWIKGQRLLLTEGPSSRQAARNRLQYRQKLTRQIIGILLESPFYLVLPLVSRLDLILHHIEE